MTLLDDAWELRLKIKALLKEAVKRNLTEGILLSGGLDTSILAFVASKFRSLKAFTVAFRRGEAPDLGYARLIAETLGLTHRVYLFDEEELYSVLPTVVKVTGSFDPMEIRNSVAIYIGLKCAKDSGVTTVMTGDGADELFAGYSFLFGLNKEKLDLELRKLWSVMEFSSVKLAEALGIEAKLPYLDPEFKSFAMTMTSDYKVRVEKGKVYGKWILRKAFEEDLPNSIVWRDKTPIEYGCGTTVLPKLFDERIPDEEFLEKRRRYLESDGVTLRDKEQMFYYEIYREVIGVPRPDKPGKVCPYCNSTVPEKATYCRTCGAYPI
ncbi:asparagine synthase [Candidatus Bathyarchaeota archaeon]|nr:asparagine synthase [Candidatus Bathyarchaeota archaeon]